MSSTHIRGTQGHGWPPQKSTLKMTGNIIQPFSLYGRYFLQQKKTTQIRLEKNIGTYCSRLYIHVASCMVHIA
jgi:hypothetical protein